MEEVEARGSIKKIDQFLQTENQRLDGMKEKFRNKNFYYRQPKHLAPLMKTANIPTAELTP